MSARTSPVRDRRVIVLAAEVAETRDRKIPGVLLGLKCKVLFFFVWVGNGLRLLFFLLLPGKYVTQNRSTKTCDGNCP